MSDDRKRVLSRTGQMPRVERTEPALRRNVDDRRREMPQVQRGASTPETGLFPAVKDIPDTDEPRDDDTPSGYQEGDRPAHG